MLVLTRKPSEQILIGKDITVTIVRIDGNKVRIGIEAPGNVTITRRELADRDQAAVVHSKPKVLSNLRTALGLYSGGMI